MRAWAALAALLASGAASAAEMSFVACPVYRDTDAGRKSGCWLADDPLSGIRYDVTQSAAKPDWNFAILVEGRVSQKSGNPCGGLVLDPIRVSVLANEPCTRHMIPAEGYPGRKYVLPERNVDPLSKPRAAPKPPFTNRTFRFFFDWNDDFLAYQREDHSLDQAITWIRGASVTKLTITGYAATEPVIVSGRKMIEDPAVATLRAARLTEALLRLGINKDRITTRTGGNGGIVADPYVDTLPQASRRRVEVSVCIGSPLSADSQQCSF